MPPSPTAAIVIIGDEILSGRTKDANLPWLAERLGSLGIPVVEARVVSDRTEAIVDAVNTLRGEHTYVFTSGGIGPTHDDITTEAVAAAFGVPVVRSPEAQALLEGHYEPGKLNAARLRMADVPEGACLVENPVSKAPGYRMDNVFVFAGIPRILQAMFDGIAPTLTGGAPLQTRAVSCAVGEGDLSAGLGAIQADFPDLSLGSYPFVRGGRFGSSVVIRGTDTARLDAARDAVHAMVAGLGGAPVDEDTAAGQI